ncbi:MAG: alanine--glyoxylate aminotransferase family protein [Myxococcales bacterium]|jgi:alanine-glyoxylate transaminase/serine-glyoxylate transaminase/serine-pyruvate transaminase|nr:MAG: alanine--glyoxylate aminotransferase family protein [Myxococcales bacterium]
MLPTLPHDRLLLGPGPSMVSPRVSEAMARPLVGHLDPSFLALLDLVQQDLRAMFRTENPLTLPISATGSAGMEACFVNLVEDGDEVVIGVAGVFGARMADVAERLGARVVRVEAPWGEVIAVERIEEALAGCKRPSMVAIVHAETSTGAWQPLEEIGEIVRAYNALLVVDAVTSLGGCPVEVDAWGIDACYSATQKCLSCPPGLAPVTFGPRALERVENRRTKPRSWYLDLGLIGGYFGTTRVYHHTAPIAMIYALAEALVIVREEGLEARFERHRRGHDALMAGLEVLGLEPAASEGHRLWMLNSVRVPHGVDEKVVRDALLMRHSIEIGAGLGPLAGKVWRIGLMGESSRLPYVRRFLLALSAELEALGSDVGTGRQAVEAADAAYGSV